MILAAGEVTRWERAAHREEKATMKRIFLAALAMGLLQAAWGADASTAPGSPTERAPNRPNRMKIRLTVEGTQLTATLIDSKTSRDFIALLPLTLTMNDLFRREKFAHLPRALSEEGRRTRTYQVGDVGYWSPGGDVAIYYRQDGEEIPDPGIIVIGKIDSGVEILNVPGSVKVTVEPVSE
jgi:hypothetical protein